jgi:hypothetical protein
MRSEAVMETPEPSARRGSFVLRCAPVPWGNDSASEIFVRSYGRRRRNELDLTDTIEAAIRVTLQEAASLSAEIREMYGVEFAPYALS